MMQLHYIELTTSTIFLHLSSFCVQLSKNIDLSHRNNKELLAIHCCAMQGRIDAIQLLLDTDTDNILRRALESEDPKTPPSLTHLALANDFLECGEWLVENGFNFKEHEQDILVHRLLTEQIKRYVIDC